MCKIVRYFLIVWKTSLICIVSTMFQFFSNIVKNIEVDVFFKKSSKNRIVKNWKTSHREKHRIVKKSEHRPPLVLGGPWGPDLVPTAPHWPAWVRLMVKTHFDLISGPFWAPGGIKRARFCPERPFWGAPRSSEGPNGPDLVPTAPEGPAKVKHRVITLFGLISSP